MHGFGTGTLALLIAQGKTGTIGNLSSDKLKDSPEARESSASLSVPASNPAEQHCKSGGGRQSRSKASQILSTSPRYQSISDAAMSMSSLDNSTKGSMKSPSPISHSLQSTPCSKPGGEELKTGLEARSLTCKDIEELQDSCTTLSRETERRSGRNAGLYCTTFPSSLATKKNSSSGSLVAETRTKPPQQQQMRDSSHQAPIEAAPMQAGLELAKVVSSVRGSHTARSAGRKAYQAGPELNPAAQTAIYRHQQPPNTTAVRRAGLKKTSPADLQLQPVGNPFLRVLPI